MADIIIRVSDFGHADSGSDIFFSGTARTSDMVYTDAPVSWYTTTGYSALASTINSTVKNAAIAQASLDGWTVGLLDKKTLIGGAVGL